MHGGVWEVVGKNRKDKNAGKTGKLSKAEKKKFIENAPKVEDFLPLDQVKSLYENFDGNKENKKPVKEKESKTKENEEKKKQQKQLQAERKKEETPKEKPPKSIEEALNLINVPEVYNLLENNQARFPDAPLVWLKTLVAYLNSKVLIEKDDPIFSGRPHAYPLSVLPNTLRVILEKAIENAGAPNVQLFYEFILTAMTMEMMKGIPVIGYKIFIQLLAKYDPKLSINNIPKLISMRNSYQNRKPIGISLLWCFNQSGRENLSIGLKVWHEVMSPMLEAKSYSSYVMRILNDLITWHNYEENLQIDTFLNIFEDFFSGKLNISQTIIDEGVLNLQQLRIILFQNKNINHRKLFEILLPKVVLKTPENFKDEIVDILVGCLIADERCFNVWKSLYTKYLYISSLCLKYIDSFWDTLGPSLNSKFLSDILSTFQLSQEKSKKSKGKDDKYLYICSNTSKIIVQKMTSKVSNKRRFSWKNGCFILFLLIGAIVGYDTYKHGSFEATSTGKFMRDTGITDFAQKTWLSTKLYSLKSLEYLEASSPEYYKAVVDFCTPYVKLGGDIYLIAKGVSIKLYNNVLSYMSIKIPALVAQIEHYTPGLLDSLKQNFSRGIKIVQTYSVLIAEQAVENSVKIIRWMRANVFVGKFSPESLQNYAHQAINTTHTFASQTYDWVYEKVQTLSKVE